MILALSGTLIAVIASNSYQMPTGDSCALENEIDFSLRVGVYVETTEVTILRTFVTISTLVLLYFIYKHYELDLNVLKAKEHIDHYETLFTSGKFKFMISELTICALHSPPKLNSTFSFDQEGTLILYSLDTFLTFVTLLRFYLIWRLFAKYSTWNNDKAEKVCMECHCQSGTGFAIKCELKERPYTIIFCAISLSIFIFGFAMRAAELPYMHISGQDWTYLWNSMWCTIITMATVGYGDFYPQTHIGRLIAILSCVWGNFLISLMVVSLTISSEFNPSQRKAYDNIMKEIGIQEHNKKAIRVIQSLLKYCVLSRKKPDMGKEERLQHLNNIRDRIKDFQQHRKKLFVKDQEIPLENQLLRVNQQISFEFDQVLSDARSIKKTMSVLSRAEDLNGEIEEKAIKVSALSEKILNKLKKFKENKFRPRIQGFDSDSDNDESNNTTVGNQNNGSPTKLQTKQKILDINKNNLNNKIAIKGLTKAGRSPTKFLNQMNGQNEEEDNIALLKLIRGGYIDQNVMANLINNVVSGFTTNNQFLSQMQTMQKNQQQQLQNNGMTNFGQMNNIGIGQLNQNMQANNNQNLQAMQSHYNNELQQQSGKFDNSQN